MIAYTTQSNLKNTSSSQIIKQSKNVNMSVLVYSSALILVQALIPFIVNAVLSCFYVASSNEKSLRLEESNLKNEMSKVSMVDEFARYARLQRKFQKIQQERVIQTELRCNSSQKTKSFLQFTTQILLSLLIVAVIFIYKTDPVVVVPKEWLFPFQKILSWPTNTEGGVSVTVWIICLRTVLNVYIKGH